MTAAVDVGTATTRIRTAAGLTVLATPPPEAIAGVLTRAAGTGRPVTCVVPDHWRDHGAGLARQELLHATVLPVGPATLIGRFAAVAAHAAARTGPGRYLVCDAGASGTGFGLCEVSGESVRLVDAAFDAAAGGDAFAEAVAPGRGREFAASAARGAERLAAVLATAREKALFRNALAVRAGDLEITAGALLEAFEPVGARLAALAGRWSAASARPVLTGGFAGFPPVADALSNALADAAPLGPHAAVEGAALFADGVFREAPLPDVRLPIHRIRDGLPAGAEIGVPGRPGRFAALNGRDLLLCHRREPALGAPSLMLDDAGTLPVEVDGRPAPCRAPGLAPGAYRLGLRAATRGPVIALFPVAPDADPVPVPLERPAR
ncbi:hypothetical protein GCM10009527_060370 [Actinomadura nitritigenes]|uniref:Uncharacterized protein n=1 Tax=Actinomadura nitritigenes TaxID=134602 RepID=A0ABS3QYE9_9ACTN|nr:hypothetical protein [Actinomadura nitritigenes]MBO2439019.1 hypothetical protein [Actinomadura nitritigenes]